MLLFQVKFKNKKNILLTKIIFVYTFLSSSNLNNFNNFIFFLNEPILCKITYMLNDSRISLYIILCIYIILNSKIIFSNYLIIFIFWIYCQNVFENNFFDYFFFTKSNNITLINGLLLIHPVMLYIAITVLICLYFFFLKQKKKKFLFLLNVINTKKYTIVLYSGISLHLGCFWAQQETNWGGWWNWDPIELSALNLFVLALVILHTHVYLIKTYKKSKNFFLFFLLLTYCLSRYDLLNSIHSFSISNQTSKFLELKFILVLLLFFLIKNSLKLKIKLVFFTLNFLLNVFFLTLIFLFIKIFFFFEFKLNLKKQIICFMLINLILDFNFFKKKLFAIFLFIIFNPINYFLMFFKKNIKINNITHIFIFSIIVQMAVESKSDIFYKDNSALIIFNKLFFLNKTWSISNHVDTNFNDFYKQRLETKNTLTTVFNELDKFFFQNIKTNFYTNKNTIDTNCIIYFFQKNLLLYTYTSTAILLNIYFFKTKKCIIIC